MPCNPIRLWMKTRVPCSLHQNDSLYMDCITGVHPSPYPMFDASIPPSWWIPLILTHPQSSGSCCLVRLPWSNGVPKGTIAGRETMGVSHFPTYVCAKVHIQYYVSVCIYIYICTYIHIYGIYVYLYICIHTDACMCQTHTQDTIYWMYCIVCRLQYFQSAGSEHSWSGKIYELGLHIPMSRGPITIIVANYLLDITGVVIQLCKYLLYNKVS